MADETFQLLWPQAGPRVVIVDDHQAMRTALRDALEDEGANVVGEADNGPAGVELAVRLQPDVVLMDLRLPGISGLPWRVRGPRRRLGLVRLASA